MLNKKTVVAMDQIDIWTNVLVRPSDNATHYGKSDKMDAHDSNGAILVEGDTTSVIKDLKVKGSSSVINRGTVFKSIHLTNEPSEIEVRSNEIKGLVLKTEFVKKS